LNNDLFFYLGYSLPQPSTPLRLRTGGDVEEISPALHMVNEARFLEEKKI